MTTERERADRGNRAETALAEFLLPAFDVVEGEYTARITEIAAKEPWETDKIRKLAAAVRIAREVRAQIEQLVADGKMAQSELQRTRAIENLPDARKRVLGIAV